MPVTAPERPAGGLFRALRNAPVDAETAYEAIEEIRDMAGQNVVAELRAHSDRRYAELRAHSDSNYAELRAHSDSNYAELRARIDSNYAELNARIDNNHAELNARIDSNHAELSARIDNNYAELRAHSDRNYAELSARIDTLADRIDTLQKLLWPLVIAVSVALLGAVAGGLFATFRS